MNQMNEDNYLYSIWSKAITGNDVTIDPGKLMKSLSMRQEKLRRAVFLRNIIEIVSAILVIGVFVYYSISIDSWISRTGSAIIIISLLFIIWKLRKTGTPENNADLNMLVFLEQFRDQLNTQITLLQNILFWYLIPLFTGIVVFIIGTDSLITSKIVVIALSAVIYLVIFLINRNAVKKELRPLLNDVERIMDKYNY